MTEKNDKELNNPKDLSETLDRNASLLLALEGCSRNVCSSPTEFEALLTHELASGLSKSSAHFAPQVVNLDPEPYGPIFKTAKTYKLLPRKENPSSQPDAQPDNRAGAPPTRAPSGIALMHVRRMLSNGMAHESVPPFAQSEEDRCAGEVWEEDF
uniref:Uncharacterized protein n=1 Tax=Tetraselmis sp. GSL018 TaxID=582737 RepID=A0A061S227_9CHLO|mmetsp:Transcript_33789/g.80192  ORF Transcript_33789/g.80192 Transcript_33789/m.80192 type:complete len:155 (+) Transcript_33789:132-596(+)